MGLRKALDKEGIKLTPQRLEVFRAVKDLKNHPSVEEVYRTARKRLPTISQDTVYRTLALFEALGLVDSFGSRDGTLRYDPDTSPHHHFICKRCKSVSDFKWPLVEGLSLPTWLRAIGDPERIQMEVVGVCVKCTGGKG